MLAIIDSDSIACACGAATELSHALSNTKNKMMSIIKRTDCSDYRAILTKSKDETAFRYKIYPEYKANRIGKDRPKFEQECREYLINQWNAEVVSEIEADDAVSILQWQEYHRKFYGEIDDTYNNKNLTRFIYPSVLCGIDKDLDQIPGLHYNYRKDTFDYITPIQGLRNLYLQMLTGDVVDNIPRIKKWWKQAEAERQINKALTEEELFDIVREQLIEVRKVKDIDSSNFFWYERDIEKEIQWRGDLLYLWTKENDKYKIPLTGNIYK